MEQAVLGEHIVAPKRQPTPFALPDVEQDRLDAVVVARMSRGDERAAAELYDMHSPRLFGLALAMVRESADAEEVILDAFTQAWHAASRFDAARGNVISWLTTIVRSRALDLIRARRRRDQAHERAGFQITIDLGGQTPNASVVPVGTSVIEAHSVAVELGRALRTLPAPQREVVELAYFAGASHSQIAVQLGLPLGTIKTRVRLALRRMRTELATFALT